VREALRQAFDHLRAGRSGAAEGIARQVLAVVPGHPEALHVRGLAELHRGAAEAAIRTLEAAAAAAPRTASIQTSLGHTLLELKRHDEAAAAAERALALAPDLVPAHHLLGITRYIQGDREAAVASLRTALRLAPDHQPSHVALSDALMPGDGYEAHLKRLHAWLKPPGYVEIGVETGATLQLATPPTRAVGIDPLPQIAYPLPDTTQVFALTSDAFFAGHHLPEVLGVPTVGLAFIDGLHVFEQALRDFMHLERFCEPGSVILLHDCLPIDGPSSEPVRRTTFWSGDPWKVTAALRRFRPDLAVCTVPCAPSGLAVITRLDPASALLSDRYDEVVAAFAHRTYDDLQAEGAERVLGIVENDWKALRERLAAAGAGPA